MRLRTGHGRLGLQARLTIVATAVVAVTLAVSAVLLLTVVRHSVLHSLDDSARQQAKDVATLAHSGQLPDPVPVGAGTAGVQVVDDQGAWSRVSAGRRRAHRRCSSRATCGRAGRAGARSSTAPGSARRTRCGSWATRSPAGNGQPAGQTVLVAVSQAEAVRQRAGARPSPLPSAGRSCWSAFALRLLAARRPGAAAGLAAAHRGRGDRRGRVRLTADGCRCRRPRTRSAGWPRRSTTCSTGWRAPARAAAGLRRRRGARAAQPAEPRSAPSSRSPGATPTRRRLGGDRRRRAGRHRPAGPSGRRPAAAGPRRRRRPRSTAVRSRSTWSTLAREVAAGPWAVPVDARKPRCCNGFGRLHAGTNARGSGPTRTRSPGSWSTWSTTPPAMPGRR